MTGASRMEATCERKATCLWGVYLRGCQRYCGLLGTWRRFHSHFPLADNAPDLSRERHLYVQGTVHPSERSGDCSFCGMSCGPTW